jgi:predicted dehydrogenase
LKKVISRRRFIQQTAIAGAAAVWLPGLPASARTRRISPNDRLNIGVIGVANQGAYDLGNVTSENIVALCDIDDNYLRDAAAQFPKAVTYNDFRRLLDRRDLDAVVIAIPDHMHAPVTLAALESGRHVYCEKPLAHTVEEARRVTETAHRLKRVTQMGTQIHASSNYRRVVELVQSGAIGTVHEAHSWSDKVWSGGQLSADHPPVPPNIHWDLWLGPTPFRPYDPAYLPGTWRGWWAFGGGTLADMACHHMDLPFWALKLHHPVSVAAEGPAPAPETTPEWLIVHYEFPVENGREPVLLTWYNGGKRPPQFGDGSLPEWGDGTLFVGEKGMLLADYDRHVLLPEKQFEGFQPPKPTIPDSIGHHAEWILACKTGGPTTCNFDYSGPLSEAVLLGNVAFRTGQKLDWDYRRLQARGCPEAADYLKPVWTPGWSAKVI